MTQIQDPVQAQVQGQPPQSTGPLPVETPSPSSTVPTISSPTIPLESLEQQPMSTPEKSFVDTMIDKGARAVASFTGQPDPLTGQGTTGQGTVQPTQWPIPQTTEVSPTVNTSSESTPQPGLLDKMRWGMKNLFGKAASTTANVAGKTLQTGAQVVGGVAQTALQTWSGLAQGVGNAIQDHQEGNFFQNAVGAVTDVAKTTVSAGSQAVWGIVDAGKTTVEGVVTVGKDTTGAIAAEIPPQLGGGVVQGAVHAVWWFADKAVQVTQGVGDKAVTLVSPQHPEEDTTEGAVQQPLYPNSEETANREETASTPTSIWNAA